MKKKPKSKRLKLILLTIAILIITGGVYAYVQFEFFLDKITTNAEPKVDGEEDVSVEYSEEPFAMVILGKDTRTEDEGLKNTDVMIVAVVQPKEKQVMLLSIPRDTRVMIPGYSNPHKINSAYSRGDNARIKAEKNGDPITVTGISLVKKTLEGLLGIPIKHYVTVDFEGFKAVIDELDGIEVDVERRLVYHDPTDGTSIDLQPGLQVLDGQQALDYVRHRHDDRGSKYYSTDFERNERQQEVIRKVADKAKSFSGVTKIFGIMNIAGDHIRTDLSKNQIKGLLFAFKSIGSESIVTIPHEAYWDGYSFTVFPKDNMDTIRKTLWTALGMTEAEGMALVISENDVKPKKQTAKKQQPVASEKKDEKTEEPIKTVPTETDTSVNQGSTGSTDGSETDSGTSGDSQNQTDQGADTGSTDGTDKNNQNISDNTDQTDTSQSDQSGSTDSDNSTGTGQGETQPPDSNDDSDSDGTTQP